VCPRAGTSSSAALGSDATQRVWEDPLRFNLDHHISSADVALTKNDMWLISFSIGHRGCIAASLGTAMSIMLFTRLLQGFTWTRPNDIMALDLNESKHDTFLAKPLLLRDEARLLPHLYPPVSND
jgi:tyrosine N-monooxygenase